jgi:hypothetical protein
MADALEELAGSSSHASRIRRLSDLRRSQGALVQARQQAGQVGLSEFVSGFFVPR